MLFGKNSFWELLYKLSSSFSYSTDLISEIFFKVLKIYEGSFFLPLYGTGGKKGESVSESILFSGHSNTASRPLKDLYVTFPQNEI